MRTGKNELNAKTNSCKITLEKETNNHSGTIAKAKDKAARYVNEAHDALMKKCKGFNEDMEEIYEELATSLEANDGENIENIIEVSNNHLSELLTKMGDGEKLDEAKFWTVGDEVAYQDEFTGVTCNVTIIEVKNRDGRSTYTIAFKNGKRKQA